jgi:hypothetical protein
MDVEYNIRQNIENQNMICEDGYFKFDKTYESGMIYN